MSPTHPTPAPQGARPDTASRLQLLDAVRRSQQADDAHTAAHRALDKATAAATKARKDHLRARAAATTATASLTAARHQRADAYRAARNANRDLGNLYRRHATGRGTTTWRRADLGAALQAAVPAAALTDLTGTPTRRALLAAIWQAEQATNAYADAQAAYSSAVRAAAAAQQELARARAIAADAHGRLEETRRTAGPKLRRTFLAARTAGQNLSAQFRPYAVGYGVGGGGRGALAGGLLGELAAAPLDLLHAADVIAVFSSGGKDSVCMLHTVVEGARQAGVLDRVVVVHADLGDQTEWPGVRDLARRQAERYGLRFVVVTAEDGQAEPEADGKRPPLGLHGLVRRRGKFPDAARRLCTATLKRAPGDKLITAVLKELGLSRQALVVTCMGIRAAESPARSRKPVLDLNTRTSSGTRLSLTWHSLFTWSDDDVWQAIHDHALEYHEVYDALLPRLSCVLCVLAGRAALVRSVRLCNALGLSLPALYLRLQTDIGHLFKAGLSLADIIAEANALDAEHGPLTWNRGDAIATRFGEAAAHDYLARLALSIPVSH